MFKSHGTTSLLPCRKFKAHENYLTRLLFSPDVRNLATCSADQTVKIWNIYSTEENLETTPDLLKSGAMSLLDNASAPGLSSQFLNSTSMTFKGPEGNTSENVDSFRPIPDRVTKQKPPPLDVVLKPHYRWVWDCAFSGDSAYLVTVSSDHYARLWE
jgi:target of rapamycin complex subunit LST8